MFGLLSPEPLVVSATNLLGAEKTDDFMKSSLRRLFTAVDAQTFRGAINCAVTDPSGALVPNAQVKATDIATGVERTAVTTGVTEFLACLPYEVSGHTPRYTPSRPMLAQLQGRMRLHTDSDRSGRHEAGAEARTRDCSYGRRRLSGR